MAEIDKKTTITKIDHIDDRFTLISGYRNGHFYAAVYDGSRLVKSMISENLNAVTDYQKFREGFIQELQQELQEDE